MGQWVTPSIAHFKFRIDLCVAPLIEILGQVLMPVVSPIGIALGRAILKLDTPEFPAFVAGSFA